MWKRNGHHLNRHIIPMIMNGIGRKIIWQTPKVARTRNHTNQETCAGKALMIREVVSQVRLLIVHNTIRLTIIWAIIIIIRRVLHKTIRRASIKTRNLTTHRYAQRAGNCRDLTGTILCIKIPILNPGFLVTHIKHLIILLIMDGTEPNNAYQACGGVPIMGGWVRFDGLAMRCVVRQ